MNTLRVLIILATAATSQAFVMFNYNSGTIIKQEYQTTHSQLNSERQCWEFYHSTRYLLCLFFCHTKENQADYLKQLNNETSVDIESLSDYNH